MSRLLAAFQPPPPEGAGNPLAWGTEEHAEELLGDSFELQFEEHVSVFEAESAEAAWEEFVVAFGPIKTLHASLDPDRQEELRRVMLDSFSEHLADGGVRRPMTYLLIRGVRR